MSFEHEDNQLSRRLKFIQGLVLILLRVEALVALLFPLVLALGLVGAFGLLGLFAPLGPYGHLIFLLFILSAAAFWLWRNYCKFHWPRQEEAWRRLEKASRFTHRPLLQLADQQATNLIDPLARALWREHRKKLAAQIRALRIGWPEFRIAERDPLAIRVVVVMLAVIALSAAGEGMLRRIGHGFLPNFAGDTSKISADIWISPPDYTRIAPLHLQAHSGEAAAPLMIPEKSRLLAQVTGTEKKVELDINDESLTLEELDPASHQIEQEVREGDELSIEVGGRELASWPIQIVKDLPPGIDFAGKPAATERGALRLPYAAKDDYGVKEAQLRLSLNGETLELHLSVPPRDNKEVKGILYQDLTAHPWAGLEVQAQLRAKDAAGQTGESPILKIALPERRFHNPVAKAIIAARKALAKDPRQNREVAAALHGLNERPDLYGDQTGIFLGLNIAWRRLLGPQYQEDQKRELPQILQLMWEIAVSLEDGRAGDALAQLRQLQKELQDALNRNAPQEEIDRLMNQIQEAMNEYLRQMQQQVEQALRQGQTPRLSKPGLSVTEQDLNKMLEDARRMAQSGAKDSAQRMLDQLQQMLENLQAGIPMPQPEGSGEGQKLLNDLAKTMRRQQQLLNDSFEQQRRGEGEQGEEQNQQGQNQQGKQQGQENGQGEGERQAGEQENLRRGLGDIMRRMAEATGELPDGMGEAEQQMRDAVQSLKRGDFPNAAEAQNKALNHLQQSLQSMSQQQRQTLGNRRDKMDPLGRLLPEDQDGNGQNLDTQSFDVPEESPFEQARRIFQELLQRRDDLSRPKSERDYLDRLLKQF